MKLNINISIPQLWGEQRFQRGEWGSINYLVGPNATGKTRFAEQLNHQCEQQKLKVRYLSAERLVGLERRRYEGITHSFLEKGLGIDQFSDLRIFGKNYGLSADALIILKEKIDIRIKIEATLSGLFGRRIRLAEEGGYLNPKIQRIEGGNEYSLKKDECHGLKELIPLLTFLYEDEYNCFIIDEPELHLHPQFQTFLLQEIRKLAGDPFSSPDKKCFFIITHSPYFVDIRSVEDLKCCIVFPPDRLPTYIDQLEGEDELRIKSLLPGLNTHHKQFFFASRPIFVEGYFDQQIYSLIQEKRGKFLGASGCCIIDAGGKDKLDLFFRLCNKLNIDAYIVTDLDTITKGALRQSVSNDNRCQEYVQNEGLGTNLMEVIGRVEKTIDACMNEIEVLLSRNSELEKPLKEFIDALPKEDDLAKKRYVFIVALHYIGQELQTLLDSNASNLNVVQGLMPKIIHAFKCAGVHILPKGKLENYLPQYNGNPYKISDEAKKKVFEQERNYILGTDSENEINERYRELINILDEASGAKEIDMDSALHDVICEWIFKVQRAFKRGELKTEESLKSNATIDWKTYSRIFEVKEFSISESGFSCRIKLNRLLDPKERECVFDNMTSAANYKLYENQTSV